jgi:hypothetical protein
MQKEIVDEALGFIECLGDIPMHEIPGSTGSGCGSSDGVCLLDDARKVKTGCQEECMVAVRLGRFCLRASPSERGSRERRSRPSGLKEESRKFLHFIFFFFYLLS